MVILLFHFMVRKCVYRAILARLVKSPLSKRYLRDLKVGTLKGSRPFSLANSRVAKKKNTYKWR